MNKNKLSARIIWFTIIVFASIILSAQTAFSQVKIDSLWHVWNNPAQPDTTRLKAMHDIAWEGYIYSQPDSTFYFAQMGYDFAKSKGLKKQMAKALNAQGVSLWYQGDYASAIDYYTRSLTINEEIGDKKGIAYSLNNIGNIYHAQGNYNSSIDYYTRSLTIMEKIGDKRGIAYSLLNLGAIYSSQREYLSAIDNYTHSLAILEEIGDKRGIANNLINIGQIYENQGEYGSALDYYTRSLTISEEIEFKTGIAFTLNEIGQIYKKQGDYTNAIEYSSRALIIAQEVGAAIETRNASEALYDVYKSAGRNKPALEMYELYIATKDSIDSEENHKEVIRQKYKYDYEKQAIADSVAYIQVQKVQEAKLEKSRILQYALIGGVTLLLVFLGYVFNRYRVTKKQKILISKQNKELETATEIAESANDELKIKSTELQTKSEELEKFNNVMLDREMRIIELKKEANNMAEDNNTDIPYPEVGDV
jgi:tetratricopeptide (TPR) repeat protein